MSSKLSQIRCTKQPELKILSDNKTFIIFTLLGINFSTYQFQKFCSICWKWLVICFFRLTCWSRRRLRATWIRRTQWLWFWSLVVWNQFQLAPFNHLAPTFTFTDRWDFFTFMNCHQWSRQCRTLVHFVFVKVYTLLKERRRRNYEFMNIKYLSSPKRLLLNGYWNLSRSRFDSLEHCRTPPYIHSGAKQKLHLRFRFFCKNKNNLKQNQLMRSFGSAISSILFHKW